MTALTPNDRFISLSPAAGTTVLAYDFEMMLAAGMSVTRVRAGVSTALVLGVDFSFPGGLGDATGGTLTLAVASLAADVYLLVGAQPEQRLSDFVGSQAFNSAKMNADLDALTIVAQEHRRDIGRAWKSPYGTAGAQITAGVDGELMISTAGNLIGSGTTIAGLLSSVSAYAIAAAASAADAAISATSASTSATNAGNSATAAAGSATSANNSAIAAAAAAASIPSTFPASLVAFKAVDATSHTIAYFDGSIWDWTLGDHTTRLAADTVGGIFVKANAVLATVGAWRRRFERHSARFYGASAGATRAANVTALQCAVNVAQLFVGELFLPELYPTSAAILVSNNLRLHGTSAFTSGITSSVGAAISLVPDTGIANNNTWYGFFNFSAISTDAGAHYGIEYASTGAEYLSNWIMEGVYASGTSGGASFDSTASTVGIFSCTLRRNWFANGLVIKDGGDSITILENTINGNGIGVLVNALKTGARQLVLRNNNITTLSECVYLLNVTGAIIDSNWMETPSYLGSYTGTTGALLYAQSSPNTRIMRNTIQPLAAAGGGFVPANYAIRLNTAGAASSVADNDIAIGAVGHIQIGAGVTGTLIHWDNKFDVTAVITDAGTSTFGAKSNTPGVWKDLISFTTSAAFATVVRFESTDTGTGNGPFVELYRNKAGGAAVSDGQAALSWFFNNSVGAKVNGAYISGTVLDPVSGTEDYQLNIARMLAGSLVVGLTLGATFNFTTGGTVTGTLTPSVNDGGALGTGALSWADLFLATGGVINFANGNYTVTHSAGVLTFNGSVLLSGASGSIGYVAGAGGAVAQATDKTTAVTLNRPTGAITMQATALAAGAIVSFTLTNSTITADDVLILNHKAVGTPGGYSLNARCAAGSATIDVRNNTAGSLSEAIVIQFALVQGAIT